MINNPYRAAEYQEQAILGASPLRLIIMTYDVAIQACELKDFARSVKAVSMLRDALDFDHGSVATGLFRLYQWSLDCIRQDDFDTALNVLREMRSAWVTVEQRQNMLPLDNVNESVSWSTVIAA